MNMLKLKSVVVFQASSSQAKKGIFKKKITVISQTASRSLKMLAVELIKRRGIRKNWSQNCLEETKLNQGAVKHGRRNGYGAPDLCVMRVPPPRTNLKQKRENEPKNKRKRIDLKIFEWRCPLSRQILGYTMLESVKIYDKVNKSFKIS